MVVIASKFLGSIDWLALDVTTEEERSPDDSATENAESGGIATDDYR
jgi:hypothetical protein